MFDTIKEAFIKLVVTKGVCEWIIKTALNAALAKSKDEKKRSDVCAMLSSGARLMGTASVACADGKVDDLEAESIEGQAIVFGQDIYRLIRG